MAKIAVVEDNDAMRAQLCGFIAQYAQESGHQLDVTAFSDGHSLWSRTAPGLTSSFWILRCQRSAVCRRRSASAGRTLMWCSCSSPTWHSMPSAGMRSTRSTLCSSPSATTSSAPSWSAPCSASSAAAAGRWPCRSAAVQLLDTDDILYLETRDRLLHYHTATDTWSVRGSLLKAEKDLAAYHFARCNQCYLVNLRHVRGVQDDLVQVGRNGWRSAAASARPFWPRWRPMSGVRCRWIHF